MNPAHPLAATAHRSTDTQTEHGQHLAQGATVRPQHNADAQHHNTTAGLCGLGGCFPCLAQVGQKIRTTGAGFGRLPGLAGAVVTHSASADEHLGAGVGSGHGLHQIPGGGNPTFLEQGFVLVGPAFLGDGLPRQVDHPLSRGHMGLPWTGLAGVGNHHLRFGREATGSVGIPGGKDELMAGRFQGRDQTMANEPCTASGEKSHCRDERGVLPEL